MSLPEGFVPNVLSIAGSDPSGGAGIQADLKTFAALGCHGMAAITALTAQNTARVSGIHYVPEGFVREQIATVLEDVDVAAIKIGMLGSAAAVGAVAAALRVYPGPVVIDPVLVATSGAALGDDAVIEAMRDLLFPRATLITPNLPEAARLSGRRASPLPGDMEDAARSLASGHRTAWLLKGGHGKGATADDLLLVDGAPHWLSSPRAATRNTHGTGCTLSSAIAAHLALGAGLRQAVVEAKAFLDTALGSADRLHVGQGPGPVDHFARWR